MSHSSPGKENFQNYARGIIMEGEEEEGEEGMEEDEEGGGADSLSLFLGFSWLNTSD